MNRERRQSVERLRGTDNPKETEKETRTLREGQNTEKEDSEAKAERGQRAKLTRGSVKHQRLERSEPSQRGSVSTEHHIGLFPL